MRALCHEFLSEYIGTSRERTTMYMNQFRRLGYLRYSRKEIVLYPAFKEWVGHHVAVNDTEAGSTPSQSH